MTISSDGRWRPLIQALAAQVFQRGSKTYLHCGNLAHQINTVSVFGEVDWNGNV